MAFTRKFTGGEPHFLISQIEDSKRLKVPRILMAHQVKYAKLGHLILNSKSPSVPVERLISRYIQELEARGTMGLKNAVLSISSGLRNSSLWRAFATPEQDKGPEKLIRKVLQVTRYKYAPPEPLGHYLTAGALGLDLQELLFETRHEGVFARTNWAARSDVRDQLTAKLIREAVLPVQPEGERPVQMGKWKLTRLLKIHRIIDRGADMPLTQEALEQKIETRQAFTIRWLKWVACDAPLEEVKWYGPDHFRARFRYHGFALCGDNLELIEKYSQMLRERRMQAGVLSPSGIKYREKHPKVRKG